MKDYLNKNETLAYITLATGLSAAIDLEKMAEGKEKTFLRYIQTYMNKYQYAVRDRLTDNNNKRIDSMVKSHIVKLVPTTSPDVNRVTLGFDYLADMAELIIDAYCKKCNGEISDCTIRESLKGCFIPEFCPDKDKCCYCMRG